MKAPFVVGGEAVPPGTIRQIEIPAARLVTHTMLNLPVTVINGRDDGPRLWLSAAVHGDEINGVEVIRQVLERVSLRRFRGVLLAVSIVNVFGFVQQSRYLPDRRDLNRSFPGSPRGSLAGRLAHLFLTEIVDRCTHGIDIHTASPPRTNLPQIRCDLDEPETRRCAEAFGAPVMMKGKGPAGSLRAVTVRKGIPNLLYEAGEPHRFNPRAIQAGVDGVLRVMVELGMIAAKGTPRRQRSREVSRSQWIRATQSGIVRLDVKLGDEVAKGEILATISDPLGGSARRVPAPFAGIIIGRTVSPLAYRGDGILHLAATEPVTAEAV